MVTKRLELIFDFGSPNAYLAMKTLPDLLDRTGANLVITPCLLGGIFKATGNRAPMVQYADAPAKLVKLSKTKILSIINNNSIGAWDIDSSLNNCCTN